MTITLTRDEAQQVLDALKEVNETGYSSLWKGAFDPEIELLRARLAQPEPEPVVWMQNDMEHFSLWPDEWHVVPLYTAPPQREWQSLTDEEITVAWNEAPRIQLWVNAFARAIEAKLKEKNA